MHDINPLENLFKNAQTHQELTPSDHVWDRLEQKIEKAKYKRKSRLYRRLFVAACMVGLIASVGWFWQGKKTLYLVSLADDYNTDELIDYSKDPIHYLKDIPRISLDYQDLLSKGIDLTSQNTKGKIQVRT